ncbi:helix-turn-helix domain-containing protein [Amycolatopsis sp. A1MSW2902]|uniref:helix-turn-helix domain-containing protein n=1 Tax=Amycolatopsis sp. A1MSW2902 TaxID=687413 RepID=UPI00307FA545
MTLARLPGFSPSRLRAARERRGLSILDLADLIGMTRSSVHKWEAGDVAPDPRRAKKAADVLGVPLQALTDLVDDEIGLAERRALNGMTARDLSRESGIDSATLSHIESGHRRPSEHQAAALAAVLGLGPAELQALWERTRARRMIELRRRAGLADQHHDETGPAQG